MSTTAMCSNMVCRELRLKRGHSFIPFSGPHKLDLHDFHVTDDRAQLRDLLVNVHASGSIGSSQWHRPAQQQPQTGRVLPPSPRGSPRPPLSAPPPTRTARLAAPPGPSCVPPGARRSRARGTRAARRRAGHSRQHPLHSKVKSIRPLGTHSHCAETISSKPRTPSTR